MIKRHRDGRILREARRRVPGKRNPVGRGKTLRRFPAADAYETWAGAEKLRKDRIENKLRFIFKGMTDGSTDRGDLEEWWELARETAENAFRTDGEIEFKTNSDTTGGENWLNKATQGGQYANDRHNRAAWDAFKQSIEDGEFDPEWEEAISVLLGMMYAIRRSGGDYVHDREVLRTYHEIANRWLKKPEDLDESVLGMIKWAVAGADAVSKIYSALSKKNVLNGKGEEYLDFLEDVGETVKKKFKSGGNYADLCKTITSALSDKLKSVKNPKELGLDTVDTVADVVEDACKIFSAMTGRKIKPESIG